MPAGRGYALRSGSRRSAPVTVFSGSPVPPSTASYRQRIPASGYGYLRTRDGTRLAIDVRLPAGKGPYPTLVEYSGYGYADPAGAQSGISPIATLLGFAVVDVNMRGTGCSGGAFDYFERLQSLDGYDVVETVARQPWVLGHRVGLTGISYGGISQLFVGATRPPHLAAITPLSVIDNTATTLYPGGILNTGFALSWGRERVHDALPASPTGGQPWALKQIRAGDRTCAANQALHGEATDLIATIRHNAHYVPAVADPLDPMTFVHRITVPVVPRLPVGRRADRRPLRRPRPALHRHAARVVHVHQRRPHRLAGPGDVQPLVRLPGALRRPPPAVAVGERPGPRPDSCTRRCLASPA